MGQPGFTADQLHLAKLPVTAGGLGLPDLPVLALVARTACIATLPRAEHTDPFRQQLICQEGGILLERLRGLSERHPSQMAGDLSDPPPGLSLRHLSRKLTKSIQSRAISDLWRRRADLDATLRHQCCSVFFCKAVEGGIYYFLRKKFENKVRKKFGGRQSSKCWFEKSSVDTKVQNAGSKKVRGAKLLCQSSKTKFEKSSVEKKFEMLVRKKFGGPNCSARVRKQSSKKVRWKKSSKCWFEKSSGGQTVLPEFENIVRKKFGGKKFEMLVRKKFGGPNCLGYLVQKKFDCKEVLQTVVERGSNRGGDFQKSSGTTIPRSRRHIQSVIWIFFRNPSLPAIFWRTFSETRFKRFLRAWSSTICFALA